MAMKRTIRDIMTENPAYCAASTPVRDVARMMVEHDCGEIPVLDGNGFPIGVVTDRDISVRIVAAGHDVDAARASSCMSSPCVTIRASASLDECGQLMKQHQIRRVPVVDDRGRCVGIVAQADMARSLDEDDAGSVVRAVSEARPLSNGTDMSAR